MGTHEAADGKHTCDYCGQTVTGCADNNSDHNCDVCGAEDITEHDWIAADCTTPKTCEICGATEGDTLEHKDEDGDEECDQCQTKLNFTITFVDYFGNEITEKFKNGEKVAFPELNTESFSFDLAFVGWADASGNIVTDITATKDAEYRALYKVTSFKDGSLQMSVDYGADGNIVLYATLFVYADTNGQFGAPVVLRNGAVVDAIMFPFANQTVYMYKIGFTADDIADSSSYIQIQIGSGDRLYEEKINQVLFKYAAMLEQAGIVDGEENAENILKAQQALIDSILRYGGAVQDCFNNDSSDITNGYLTADKDDLAIYKGIKAIETEKDAADSDVTTDFVAAVGNFGTTIALRYYYDVTVPANATDVKIGIIYSDKALVSPSGKFVASDAAKFYDSVLSNNVGTYMFTTEGMTINEMEDKFATIYVEYTVDGITNHYYGDVIQYGVERYVQTQIYQYSPMVQDEQGNEIGGEGKTVTSDKYTTEQYVNMLIRILQAHQAAKNLAAERGTAAD